ncbi:MAG: DUF4129 domain-containing protein [Chloroflexi bacterium]|nr:DUF4129 domain-containing protein [Chloroflexota bacterium]
MRRLALAAALVAAFALATPGTAAGPQEARSAVARALALVEQASQAPVAERPALARAALDALAAAPELADFTWLRDPLAASPPELARARARLAAAQEALEPPAGALDPAARSSLDRILSNPPFKSPSVQSLLPSWLVPVAVLIDAAARVVWNLVRWPFDRLLDLLRWVFTEVVSGPAALALGLLAIAGLVLLYRRGLRAALVAQAEVAASDEPLPPTAAEALAAAQRYAAAGQYREACHFVLLSALLSIEAQGWARLDRAATNREHLARLATQPSVAAALAPVVARFDRLWYGQDTVTDADYRELLRLAGRVREATP